MSNMSGPIQKTPLGYDGPEEADDEPTGTRRLDPELRTMGAMLRLLGELPEPAQARVVEYLARRFRESRADPCV